MAGSLSSPSNFVTSSKALNLLRLRSIQLFMAMAESMTLKRATNTEENRRAYGKKDMMLS